MTNETQWTGLGLLERVMLSTVTTILCYIFFLINVMMLFTLRSKLLFLETSRYVLLFNLLLADTIQIALSQVLYILSACRIFLTYPVCGLLVMIANITNEVSPLTLVAMSLERYVAVCYPLRHATIVSVRNTGGAIVLVWSISLLNVLTQVLLLLHFPFKELESLKMKDFCSSLVMFLGPLSDHYDRAYTSFLFISATVAITSSYIGVIVAARSASTDKASAQKARKTLLLHLVQLGLSLCSTMHNSLIIAVSKAATRTVLLCVLNVFYVFIIILPRCLSSLIYGLRDQSIRPVLFDHLCCCFKLSVVSVKAKVSL